MMNTIEVEKSSGNVFEDLGLPDATEMCVKAVLAMKINGIIKTRKLSRKKRPGRS